MLKVDNKIVYKVRQRLSKLCAGDISQMQKVLDVVCDEDRSWGSGYLSYLKYLSQPFKHYVFERPEELATQACKQIRERGLADTTEKPPPTKTQSTTEKTYNQLTLDFSDTTNSPPGGQHGPVAPVKNQVQPKWQQEEHLVCQKFNGKREKKGWLAPQYKYFDECGRSHTTTDPSSVPAGKIYGPYWTYRWAKPGKLNDGNLYLGATSSRKFQHFSVVWERCENTTEILQLLGR
ncbi:hypothetical protein [Vibrio sp.]|uniref:hypothetical protein n=1 Tax=Vibrio sp. TaxID=678 RepID=UPI003D120656